MNIREHLFMDPDIFKLVKSGAKQATVRFGECLIKTPESFQIINNENDSDRVSVKLLSLHYSLVTDLTPADFLISGKESITTEYLDEIKLRFENNNKSLCHFYQDATPISDIVSVIKFELIKD